MLSYIQEPLNGQFTQIRKPIFRLDDLFQCFKCGITHWEILFKQFT